MTKTPRLGLNTYTAGSDPHPGRAEYNARMQQLDALAAIAAQGTQAERPTAGTWGRLYWARDVARLYWDTGSAWVEVTNVGGGGAGAALAVGGAGSEGTSGRAARADHVHPLPLATATAHGGMSSTDKARLNAATNLATASTLAARDADGRLRVSAPADAGDAAPKGYVDAQVATRAPAAHTHAWADVTGKPATFAPAAHTHAWAELTGVPDMFAPAAHTHTAADVSSGVLDPARLPAASATAPGALSAALFGRLNGATSAATANALALRDAAGRLQVAGPAAAGDAATKGYVDAATANIAGAGHTHAWADITGKPATFAPAAHTHAWAELTGVPADLAGRTTTATASTVVTRSSAGYFDVKDPTAAAHPASKGYVDAQVADKRYIYSPDGLSYAVVTDSALVYRNNGNWRFAVNGDGEIYVGRLPWSSLTGVPSTFTPSGHTHSATDLTSGTVPYARVQGSTSPQSYAVSGSGTFYSVWVDGAGRFGRNTSSRRYKAAVEAWTGDGAGVLALEPVTYVRRNEDGTVPEDPRHEFGLIAEDVAEVLPDIVVHDEAGRVDGVRYDLLPVAMVPVLQDLAARVSKLEAGRG